MILFLLIGTKNKVNEVKIELKSNGNDNINNNKKNNKNNTETSLIIQQNDDNKDIINNNNNSHDNLTNEDTVFDIKTVIQNGLSTITKVSIFNNPSTFKYVGHICKVYWDQDNVWYTGRVLLYDSIKELYLIYFDIDQTTEWINISQSSEDYVLLAEELTLHRNWPAIQFTGSDKGLKYVQKKNGYSTGYTFISLFFIFILFNTSYFYLICLLYFTFILFNTNHYLGTYIEYFPTAKLNNLYQHAFTKVHELKSLIANWNTIKLNNQKIQYSINQSKIEIQEIDKIRKVSNIYIYFYFLFCS